jgi:hypothetical protein
MCQRIHSMTYSKPNKSSDEHVPMCLPKVHVELTETDERRRAASACEPKSLKRETSRYILACCVSFLPLSVHQPGKFSFAVHSFLLPPTSPRTHHL